MHKVCGTCGARKAFLDFPKNPSSPDGYYSKCKACRKIYAAEYRKRPDVIAKETLRLKAEYANNRESKSVSRRARYAVNREATLAKNRQWRDAHLEQHRAQCRQWAKDNPVAMRVIVARRRALVLGAEGSHTAADVRALFDEQQGFCTACQADLSATGYHVDHIHPVSKGGSNAPGNLQLLCPTCNRKKSAKLNWVPDGP